MEHIRISNISDYQKVVRSFNGTYHIGYGGTSVRCNLRSGIALSQVFPTNSQIEKAPSSVFCKKCFPSSS